MFCLIVGQPNCGKTTFMINFALHLGFTDLELTLKQAQGSRCTQVLPTSSAHKVLVSEEEHTTKQLQSLLITLPKGKKGKGLRLVDSCGLQAGIHSEKEIRLAMAQTIEKMTKARLVLHVIDLTDVAFGVPAIDQEINSYLQKKSIYCILANKMDLDNTLPYLENLKKQFPTTPLYPISALFSIGFKEVYNFVLANC